MNGTLDIVDPILARLIQGEMRRQEETLSLIAAENLTYEATLEVHGSVLTNKVVEGYPGRRFHSGCEYIDEIERLAIERAKTLFKADHVNVQPHSGVNANLAVYASILKPGDRILSMDISHGGHLSHGSKASIAGSKLYYARHYTVDKKTEQVDFDQLRTIAKEFHPNLIIAGYSAYPRAIQYEPFREVADMVGAYLMVDMAHIAGLVAAGEHPSPVPLADFITGTCYKTLRGTRGGFILCKREYSSIIDKAVFPGTQGSISVVNMAGKALTFKLASTSSFKLYCQAIIRNARHLAECMREQGFRIVTGGSDTHQVLVDLRELGITGVEAEKALETAGIHVNRNLIPFDPEKPKIASGLRLGTSAITARGIGQGEIGKICDMMKQAIMYIEDKKPLLIIKKNVAEICQKYPVYLDRWIDTRES